MADIFASKVDQHYVSRPFEFRPL